LSIQLVTTGQQRSFQALQTSFEFVQVKRLGEWQAEKIGTNNVRMTTREQLIMDCLSMPEKCGGIKMVCQALWAAQKQVDWKKLEELSLKSNDVVRRRLGYVSELLKVRKMKPSTLVGWRWLDPSAKKQMLAKSKKWGLILNVEAKELTEWRET
jgi:predicted transcriptional regulator of viral defense system